MITAVSVIVMVLEGDGGVDIDMLINSLWYLTMSIYGNKYV